MKLVCISDTHMLHRKLDPLPKGDVLIHAGDALSQGSESEFWAFARWTSRQEHSLKLYVPGNHDFFVWKNPDVARSVLAGGGTTLLIDQGLKWNGIKFYGSPWVPNLERWAYYGDHLTLLQKFQQIHSNTDVLITHGPPAGRQDLTSHSHVGSTELRDRLRELHLELHVFGHIHEGYGRVGNSINAAICTRDYQPTNIPIVVELDHAVTPELM